MADDCATIKGTPEGNALFDKACKAKDLQGCFELAARYVCGAGVPRDMAKAVQLSEQACDGGLAQACGNASGLQVRTDEVKARRYAEKGCQLKDISSCNNLGLMLWQGVGGPADPARAVPIFDEMCKRGMAMACANLGTLFWMGSGVPRDLARAKALCEKGCAGGAIGGCNTLGVIALNEGGDGPMRAAQLFDKVCAGGDANGCDNLGQLLEMANPPEKEKAAQLYKRACDMDFAKACTHLARLKSQ